MSAVSVVIPTYNREITLLRAIGSVLAQSVPALEILVCDDGSTDNSRARVAALNNPLIRWIDCGKNGMPAIPRNIGIKSARGEYVAFLDSDDTWLQTKIERQLQALAANGKAAISSNAYRIKDGKNLGPYLSYEKNRITLSDLASVNIIVCSSALLEKRLLDEVSLFPEEAKYKACEDYALWLRLATGIDFCYLPEPLVEYYDDPHSSIRKNRGEGGKERGVVLTGYLEWLRRNGIRLRYSPARKVLRAYYKSTGSGRLSCIQRLNCALGRIPPEAARSRTAKE